MKKSSDNLNLIRLNKFIAMSGVASRRHADELIREGAVRVNGKTITDLGTRVHPNSDQVVVNNKPIRAEQEHVYVAFNKPLQVVSTMNDPHGRPSLADFFAKARTRVFPVGRLDWDSEGLILLTNDGEFAQRVSHPKHGVAKTYLAKLSGLPTDEQLQKLVRGVSIFGGKAKALHVERLSGKDSGRSAGRKKSSGKYGWVKIIINEGRNRQVRQMFQKIGFDVRKLQRVAIGSLRIGSLERGRFRILTSEELARVFRLPKELTHRKG